MVFQSERVLDGSHFLFKNAGVGAQAAEYLSGLVDPSFSDQPPWRLWCQKQEAQKDRRGNGHHAEHPAPVALAQVRLMDDIVREDGQ